MVFTTVTTQDTRYRFFASSNAASGFVNRFPQCFGKTNGVEQLYILKGGPGTGKSHLLKSVGRVAEEHGYHTTYYCCSSDPVSLDGVIMKKKGKPTMGFLDGTAPHVWEPTAPGVHEEILNLGTFWNADALRSQKQEIIRLATEKENCYAEAYRYLRACGEVMSVADCLMEPYVKKTKLMALAKRLLREQVRQKAFRVSYGGHSCVGMTGCGYLQTYERMAQDMKGEIIDLEETYGLAYLLTDALYEYSKAHSLHVMVSKHPIFSEKMDGLFYPDTGLCILVGHQTLTAVQRRTVQLTRYFDHRGFREVRGEVRHNRKISDELINCACHRLSIAGRHHFDLEKIYATAMNFTAKESFDREICRTLFSD